MTEVTAITEAEEALVRRILCVMPILSPASVTRVLVEAERIKELESPWREIEQRLDPVAPAADGAAMERLLLTHGTVVKIHGIPVRLDSPALVLAHPSNVILINAARATESGACNTASPG